MNKKEFIKKFNITGNLVLVKLTGDIQGFETWTDLKDDLLDWVNDYFSQNNEDWDTVSCYFDYEECLSDWEINGEYDIVNLDKIGDTEDIQSHISSLNIEEE